MFLEIIHPDKTIFKGSIKSLNVPGYDGNFQILNNHADISSILKKGIVKIEMINEKTHNVFIDENLKRQQNKNNLTYSINEGLLKLIKNKITLFVYDNL